MCWQVLMTALGPGAATATAGSALTAVGGIGGTVGGAALTASAGAQLTTALSSASFITSTVGNLLGFAQQAKQASAMGRAAVERDKKTQMQLAERERQEMLRDQIERDQLARNAAIGIAKTRTLATGMGMAEADDRVIDFMVKSEEMAGIERANFAMMQASLAEAGDQSFLNTQAAVEQARSATGPMALAGLGANIAGGFFDSYRAFGALPFEDPTKYSTRVIHGIA